MYMLQYTVPHFNTIKCVCRYQNTVCVLYTVDIYTQKDTHGPIVSAAHSVVTLHIPHIPTDTLHTELDTLRRQSIFMSPHKIRFKLALYIDLIASSSLFKNK